MWKIALFGSTILILSGCVTGGPPFGAMSQDSAMEASYRGDVEAERKSGSLKEITDEKVPGLNDLINVRKGTELSSDDPKDQLRYPALRDAALSYGARGGLSYASRQINKMLQQRASEFNNIYDFSKVMVPGPDQTMVLPPVISEAKDSYEMADGGKTLRLADSIYEIIQQARFTPVSPLWHSYLIREYSPPTPPENTLLPKNDGERDLWRRWVTEGWEKGVEQAHEIFQSDLNRLERDFTGMVRYKQLHAQGKVSDPVLSDTDLGVTGNGDNMRVNDRAVRIMQDPTLQTDPAKWDNPTVSPLNSQESATPPGKEEPQRYQGSGNYIEVGDIRNEISNNIDRSLDNMDETSFEEEVLSSSINEEIYAEDIDVDSYRAPSGNPIQDSGTQQEQQRSVVPTPGRHSEREMERLRNDMRNREQYRSEAESNDVPLRRF